MNLKEIMAIADALVPAIQKYVKKELASFRDEIPSIDEGAIATAAAALVPAPEPGQDGKDGASVSLEDVRPLIAEAIADEVAKIEPPAPGKDGAPGERGEKGDPGEGVSEERLQEIVKEEVASIQVVVPEAEPGRDALQIEVLPAIDVEKSYARGSYATHRGGLWRSYEKTSGMRGWEPIVNGVAETRIERADPRTFRLVVVQANGQEVIQEYRMPFGIYRGHYSDDADYHEGDFVSRNGSVWCALTDRPQTKPGMGNREDWELTVKKGADGKR